MTAILSPKWQSPRISAACPMVMLNPWPPDSLSSRGAMLVTLPRISTMPVNMVGCVVCVKVKEGMSNEGNRRMECLKTKLRSRPVEPGSRRRLSQPHNPLTRNIIATNISLTITCMGPEAFAQNLGTNLTYILCNSFFGRSACEANPAIWPRSKGKRRHNDT